MIKDHTLMNFYTSPYMHYNVSEEGQHDISTTNILRLNLLESLFRKAKYTNELLSNFLFSCKVSCNVKFSCRLSFSDSLGELK